MGQTSVTPNTCCVTAQNFLDNIAKENKPSQITRGKLGVLKTLMSPQNTKGSKLEFTRPDGKNLDVRLTYDLPQCLSATTTLSDPCTIGTAESSQRVELKLSVDKVVQIKKTFDAATYKNLCENKDDAMNLYFMPMVQALMEAQNTELTNLLLANMNNYYNGNSSAVGSVDVKTIKAFNTEFKPNVMGLYNVKQEYVRKGYSDTPFLIGGDTVSALAQARQAFAGNYDKTFDISSQGGFNVVEDFDLDLIIGDTDRHAITFLPSVNHVLEAYKNVGEFELFRELYKQTTMTYNGYKFDYYEKMEECGTRVSITLEKRFDLFTLPANYYGSCTSQPANLHWLMDCGDMACSDITVS